MKVLLALDPSEVSQKAVAQVGKFFAGNKTADITLYHVVDCLPEYLLSRSSEDTYRDLAQEWAANNKATGEKLLAQAQQQLVAAGVPASCIRQKLCEKAARPESRRVVATLAIIEEMKQGYDLVVLGRRGASQIETTIGSVAEKVLREAQGRTVWVVD